MFYLGFAIFFSILLIKQLFFRNIKSKITKGFDQKYTVALVILIIITMWLGTAQWRFEYFLTKTALAISANPKASVRCTTPISELFEDSVGIYRDGWAYPKTGEIVIRYGWCKALKQYIKDPYSVNGRDKYALLLFTHEVMHITGYENGIDVHNEQLTECRAIQHVHLTAEAMGLPIEKVKNDTIFFFHNDYLRHPYFSNNCGPGKSLDVSIEGSIFNSI